MKGLKRTRSSCHETCCWSIRGINIGRAVHFSIWLTMSKRGAQLWSMHRADYWIVNQVRKLPSLIYPWILFIIFKGFFFLIRWFVWFILINFFYVDVNYIIIKNIQLWAFTKCFLKVSNITKKKCKCQVCKAVQQCKPISCANSVIFWPLLAKDVSSLSKYSVSCKITIP